MGVSSQRFLSSSVFQPNSRFPEFTIPDGNFDFETNPFDDDNWRFQLNSLRAIESLFDDNIMENKEHFLAALEHTIKWINCDNEIGNFGGFRWHDMATGLRAQKIALLCSLIPNFEIQPEYLILLRHTIAKHISKLSEPSFLAGSNHGIFQMHGLMSLARINPIFWTNFPHFDYGERDSEIPREEISGAIGYATKMMAKLVNSQFDSEGIHIENSPEYHFFMITTIEKILSSGWYDELQKSSSFTRIRKEACWLLWPDGGIVPIGETSDTAKINNDWIEIERKNHDSNLISLDSDKQFHSKTLRESGYTVIRTPFKYASEDSSMLFSTSSFNSHLKRHADDFNFLLFEKGGVVFSDPGKFSYNKKSKFRPFVRSTSAHNCLEIDGQDYPVSKEGFYKSALQNLKVEKSAFHISLYRKWEGIDCQHWRYLIYQPGEFIVVIDAAKSLIRRNFKQWFHLSPSYSDITQGEGGDRLCFSGGPVPVAGKFFSSNISEHTINVFRGSEDPIQGWISPSYGEITPAYAFSSSLISDSPILGAIFSFSSDSPDLEITLDESEMKVIVSIDGNTNESLFHMVSN